MAENTNIEWCDHTFNPWIGCTEVSKACTGGGGCDRCYAKVSTPVRVLRNKGIETWGPGAQRVRTKTWGDPVKWNKQHEAFYAQHGRRQRVFCASLADVFDNEVPAEWRADLFDLIVTTPNLDWLLLTKRIGNVPSMLPPLVNPFAKIFPNVWIGATIVNQAEADRDIPKLLQVPAAKRFLSMEPLLGPVDLTHIDSGSIFTRNALRRIQGRFSVGGEEVGSGGSPIDWVIVGGESGPGARECHVSHIRSIVQQCKAAGVPVFVKQLGAQPRGWCAANVHIDPAEAAELDADYCDFYEAGESRACSGRCVVFHDKKGGDPAEWPEDLRVREVPYAR